MQILDTLHSDSPRLSLREEHKTLSQSQETLNSSDTTSHYTPSPSGAREGATPLSTLDFELPPELEAGEPPEARGLARDEVCLMVSYRENNRVVHTQFRQIGGFLDAGDLLVINTSGTMNAALHATRTDGMPLELHLSTHLPADLWVVEVRTPQEKATAPFYDVAVGETLSLPAGGEAKLLTPRLDDRSTPTLEPAQTMDRHAFSPRAAPSVPDTLRISDSL